MPDSVKDKFPNTTDFSFDMEEVYQSLLMKSQKTLKAVELSQEDHFRRITENADHLFDAIDLLNILQDEIRYRLSVYTNCLAKSTKNYFNWLYEQYVDQLRQRLRMTLPIRYEEE
jgi:hypothetical protein